MRQAVRSAHCVSKLHPKSVVSTFPSVHRVGGLNFCHPFQVEAQPASSRSTCINTSKIYPMYQWSISIYTSKINNVLIIFDYLYLHYILLYYNISLYYILFYCVILYYIILHFILYYIVLYYINLYNVYIYIFNYIHILFFIYIYFILWYIVKIFNIFQY